MKIKPTLWKTIVSILAFIITAYYYSKNNFMIGGYVAFDWASFLVGLTAFIIIYIIWSLTQKK